MPTPTKGRRLGGSSAHQRHILANLATSLFEHRRITTTEAKARRLRPFAERLITFGKRGDLHARRQVLSVVRDKGVVHTLFTEIGPSFAERDGGYTRITKIGPRKGDNAPMAVIELVTDTAESTAAGSAASAATQARRSRSRRRGGRAAAPAPATATEAAPAEGEAGTEAAPAEGEAGTEAAEAAPSETEAADSAAEEAAEAGDLATEEGPSAAGEADEAAESGTASAAAEGTAEDSSPEDKGSEPGDDAGKS